MYEGNEKIALGKGRMYFEKESGDVFLMREVYAGAQRIAAEWWRLDK
jgi:hypothetical protein